MKKCSEMAEYISLYIDNELDLDERKEFEDHIAECQNCKNELDEIMQIVNICKNIKEEELPDNFREELHRKLLDASGQSGNKSKILFFRSKYFKMLSSIAAVFLLFFLIKGVYDFNSFVGSKTGGTAPQMKSVAPKQNASADQFTDQANGSGTADTTSPRSEIQAGKLGGTASGRAAGENRDNQYSLDAAVASPENVVKNQTNIVITVDDPSAKLENVKDIAAKSSGVEQSAITATVDSTITAFTIADAGDSVELNFSFPSDQYNTFLTELTSSFGQQNIQQGAIETEDMTVKLEDLIRQSDALDVKIGELEKKTDTTDQSEIDKLKEEKRTLQSTIDAIRLGTDLTYVKVVLKKPAK